jgi:glycine dehydrogenase subunit 2
VLVPESAHGTNPATAALLGFEVVADPGARRRHRRRGGGEGQALGPDVAAIMLTNPNTCGLFEREIVEIAEAVHEAGRFFYCDGANFNAIVGKVRPGDLGVDAMHINLHKTFSTPHGGGGPGAGPVVLSRRWRPSRRCRSCVHGRRRSSASSSIREGAAHQPFGRMTASTARWACSCARSPTC